VEGGESNLVLSVDKPAKKVKEARFCLCCYYEVVGETEEEVFATGCESETKSTFAQGHDARLVSFLVDSHFDGYKIRMVRDGQVTRFPNPEAAAVIASAALGEKARKATDNRAARNQAQKDKAAERDRIKAEKKAEKEAAAEKAKAEKAAKANEPKATGAEVAAGSQAGDLPELPEGHARIKVGRHEYVAAIDAEGNATYTDGKNHEQTVNRDGYRLLQG
jgi:hypothetical protein